MQTFSVSLALCARNSSVTSEFPSQRPVTQNFDVFFDLRLNKRLSRQSNGGDLKRYHAHYDVTVMCSTMFGLSTVLWADWKWVASKSAHIDTKSRVKISVIFDAVPHTVVSIIAFASLFDTTRINNLFIFRGQECHTDLRQDADLVGWDLDPAAHQWVLDHQVLSREWVLDCLVLTWVQEDLVVLQWVRGWVLDHKVLPWVLGCPACQWGLEDPKVLLQTWGQGHPGDQAHQEWWTPIWDPLLKRCGTVPEALGHGGVLEDHRWDVNP